MIDSLSSQPLGKRAIPGDFHQVETLTLLSFGWMRLQRLFFCISPDLCNLDLHKILPFCTVHSAKVTLKKMAKRYWKMTHEIVSEKKNTMNSSYECIIVGKRQTVTEEQCRDTCTLHRSPCLGLGCSHQTCEWWYVHLTSYGHECM